VLIKHVESFAKVAKPELESSAHKSEMRMGQLLAEDETSLEGTIKILRKIGAELELADQLMLVHGDQLTVNRVQGAQAILANEESRRDRLTNFLPVPGGFHFRWKILRLITDNWWGDEHSPGCVAHARQYLQRTRVDRKASLFSHTHDLLEDLLEAHVLVLFWKFGGSKDTQPQDLDQKVRFYYTAEKEKQSDPQPKNKIK